MTVKRMIFLVILVVGLITPAAVLLARGGREGSSETYAQSSTAMGRNTGEAVAQQNRNGNSDAEQMERQKRSSALGIESQVRQNRGSGAENLQIARQKGTGGATAVRFDGSGNGRGGPGTDTGQGAGTRRTGYGTGQGPGARSEGAGTGQGYGRNQSAGDNKAGAHQDEQLMETVLDKIASADVSEEEKDGLLFMIEEEKLARDVYAFLYERWGVPVFNNIASSEQTHMSDLLLLIERYDLENPVTNDTAGVFADPALQKLYVELTEMGSKSLIDALTVGATIEDLDIADLMEQREVSDNEDLDIVYQNLEKGSRNHLRSFTGQLERYGTSYTPQYISQEYLNVIVSSQREIGTMITDSDFRFE